MKTWLVLGASAGGGKIMGWILILVALASMWAWPLFSMPAVDGQSLSARPSKYQVSGRLIMQTVQLGEKRLFRFFNDVGGNVELTHDVSSVEATGMVHVTREMDRVAAIKLDNLTGLRDKEIAVGNTVRGRVLGHIQLLGVVDDIDVPVKITRYDQTTYIVEPLEAMLYSLEELELEEEMGQMMQAEAGLSDVLRLYFKWVLHSADVGASK